MPKSELRWLVVNPDGKLLAVLDSESEAYWFTRNRGHAHGAEIRKADCDYAAAPELLAALKACLPIVAAHAKVSGGEGSLAHAVARAAIAKAKGQP